MAVGHPTATGGGWPTLTAHATTVTAVTAFSDLSHHGDADLVPGLVDLAVNVRSGGTPAWPDTLIREADIAAYPDQGTAVAAVAARHRRAPGEVLLTAGAAEAFVLLARTLRPRHAVVVHPQFTEPEAALRAAGHEVDQVILPFPFAFDPGRIPADADLVSSATRPIRPRSRIRVRRWPNWCGRGGWSWSTRHSPTACRASANPSLAAATWRGWWWSVR